MFNTLDFLVDVDDEEEEGSSSSSSEDFEGELRNKKIKPVAKTTDNTADKTATGDRDASRVDYAFRKTANRICSAPQKRDNLLCR